MGMAATSICFDHSFLRGAEQGILEKESDDQRRYESFSPSALQLHFLSGVLFVSYFEQSRFHIFFQFAES
jgi:hypothetical protein